jgi:hypothetical protein
MPGTSKKKYASWNRVNKSRSFEFLKQIGRPIQTNCLKEAFYETA